MKIRRSGLWRHPDFLKLWAGQTVSAFGSQISTLALPLAAVILLKATPFQMGLLLAVESAPALLGLVAGAWIDRLRRRPLMIAMDLGRALLLCAVPLAAWRGMLTIELLYVVGFLTSTLWLLFDAADQSYLPTLIEREQLVDGNSKLEASRSLARVIGPGLAGGLVQALSAPTAIIVDAVTFLCSALSLGIIQAAEPPPAPDDQGRLIWREIAEGLRTVLGNPVLRAVTACSATFNLFDNILFAVYVLYLTSTLGISAALVGTIFALGGLGGLLGALLAGPLAQRFSLGRTLLGGAVLAGVGEVCIALAGGPPLLAVLLVAVSEASVQCGATIFGINGLSLRQMVTPDRLQGRVNATVRCISSGLSPLGALAGGYLGSHFGLRTTALVAGLGTLTAACWVLSSPIRTLRNGA